MHRKLLIWGRKKKYRERERGVGDVLTRRVRERVHFWARPTMEKGSQCVGMKEWRSDTVAIPPIVDRSSALILPTAIALTFFTLFFSSSFNSFFLSLRFSISFLLSVFFFFRFAQHLLTTEPSTTTTATTTGSKNKNKIFVLRSENWYGVGNLH